MATKARDVVNFLTGYVSQFRNKHSILTIGVLATIFTWGFVQGTKKYVLTPAIRRYIIKDRNDEDPLNKIRWEAFGAECIEWAVLMSVLILLSYVFGKRVVDE